MREAGGGGHLRPPPACPAAGSACLLLLLSLLISACQPPASQVTLALLGDVLLGRGVTPSRDSFAPLAAYLAAADLSLANLESPLGQAGPAVPGVYDLCAPPARAALLEDWGLDLVSINNNHAYDCASGSMETTSEFLAMYGISALTTEPVRREVNGLTLVFLAFEQVTHPLDVEQALEAIRQARTDGAVVIVSIHWGLEYQGAPGAHQQDLAAQFAGAGADLIWGHHPHVLQPAAWIETGRGRTLVLYSLGNALFDQGGLEDTRQSALALVTLAAQGVVQAQAIPFEIDVPHSLLRAADEQTAVEVHNRLGLP